MKYFDELNDLESELIRFQTLKSLVSVISNGVEYSKLEDVQNSFWTIEGMIEDIQEKSFEKFEVLFEAVRADESDNFQHPMDYPAKSLVPNPYEFTMAETPKTSDYNFQDLTMATNSWHQDKIKL